MLGGQAQLLAEMSRVLVDGEPGRCGGDLEQDPLRLAEVDREEVVAVDDRRHRHSGPGGPLLPAGVVGVLGVPGDVVEGARSRDAHLRRRVIAPVEVALFAGQPVLTVAEVGEAERLGQQPAVGVKSPGDVGAGALDAEDGVIGRHLRVLGAQRRVAVVCDHELQAEPVVVSEAQRPLGPLALVSLRRQSAGPEVERVLGGDAELDGVDHAGSGPARPGAGELEPGQDRPGGALLIAEVQVVGIRGVEIDRLLDQAQAEDVGVEVDVAAGVAGDHGQMVHAFKLHGVSVLLAGVGFLTEP